MTDPPGRPTAHGTNPTKAYVLLTDPARSDLEAARFWTQTEAAFEWQNALYEQCTSGASQHHLS